ncbi:MAG: nicotinate-nucleotide--dimethylbenzimidazole phosphoribosyltransferase [Bacteroidetes bacterium]|jgi:nicotinate-nucleotide--dimethylbenzimidazole phosphoribosyltransferase|nr:nicotinate-nucleotide--dimethylbenzimidazole phosphoribosyltransferase [Bacteroidota bacterium]
MSLTEELNHKIDYKTKPQGSLGKLEDIARQIGVIQHSLTPELKNPCMLVFAADHGLTEEGISPFPKEVTQQMVLNFLNGGAAINVFCQQHNIALKVVDAGVDGDLPGHQNLIGAKIERGTRNMLHEPAMTKETCRKAMEKGKELVRQEAHNDCNVIGFGEMGIGNTSSAALLMHAFTGYRLEDCTGRGTGHDASGVDKKIAVLKNVAQKYSVTDPFEKLATFGGLEIAMMCGAMLEAYEQGMVLLIDGFIATATLLAAFHINNKSILTHCVFCHLSNEKGHALMLDYLKAEPLLHLNMRLGEGTGAAVAFPIIQSAVAFLNDMASFDEAGVSNKS